VLTAAPPAGVLGALGLEAARTSCLKDVPLGNGNWLVELAGGGRQVLRRYHAGATAEDLRYEHAPRLAGRARGNPAARRDQLASVR
jgi:hypothetical protein